MKHTPHATTEIHARRGTETFDTQTYFETIAGWPKGGPMNRLSVTYITGYVLSLVCTIAAYVIATNAGHFGFFTLPTLAAALIALALAQLFIQFFFFFHFGRGSASRERLFILLFTLLIVGILVSGSLWIMFTLNARMMPSTQQMEQYMNDQTGI
jgi:cytochrome o ubiquinol oxidase operon protein cyoD